jgi:hypothetical protein
MTEAWLKPGQTLLVRMFKGSPPAERPINLYDARDVLKFCRRNIRTARTNQMKRRSTILLMALGSTSVAWNG